MGTIKKFCNANEHVYRASVRKAGFPDLAMAFMSKRDAQNWIYEREAEMSRGVFVDTRSCAKTTLLEILKKYEEEITPHHKGKDSETCRLRALQKSLLAPYAVLTLAPARIAEWRDKRLLEVSGSTVNRDMNLLHHVIEVARKEWGVNRPTNPVSDVRRPKHAPSRARRLMPGEETLLLQECGTTRAGYMKDCIALALETAMRQAEIVGLDWQFIDLEKQTAYLPVTKNGNGRGIPLSKKAVEVLASRPEPHKGPVFGDLTAEALKRAFIRLCKRAKVEDFHFHDLRHEAASRLFEKGLSAMQVASITGHKSLDMLRRYTHLRAGDLAHLLDRPLPG